MTMMSSDKYDNDLEGRQSISDAIGRGIRNANLRENWPNYLSAGAGIGCGILGLSGNDALYAHNLQFPLRALTDIFAGSATGYLAALGSRSALNHTISYFQDMTAHEERGRARHE